MFRRIKRLSFIWVGIACLLGKLSAANAEVLTLEGIIQKSINVSYELKIAQKDIQISKTDITAARSEWLPNIKASANMEYLRSLSGQLNPVTTIGNTVLPSGTRFQDSVGLNLNQKLWDSGITLRKIRIAKKDVSAKQAIYDQTLRDLKIKLIELYTDALMSYRAMKANEAMLDLSQQGYQMKKRLYQAGTLSGLDVTNEAIQVAQTLDELETLKHDYEKKLNGISYYTQVHYSAMETDLEDLSQSPEISLIWNELDSPEARRFNLQIDQKQQEVEMLKRQYLPQISLYSYYNLYGYDPEQWSKAITSLSQRTVQFGLNVSLPIFDGLKNKAAIEKAKLEKEKLVFQKLKTLAELKQQAEGYQQQVDTQHVLLETKAVILNRTQDKLTLDRRLSEQQVIDKTKAIQDHIARIQKQLEMEKSLIQSRSALKRLQTLESEGSGS